MIKPNELKRRAKHFARDQRVSLAKALEAVSKQIGFESHAAFLQAVNGKPIIKTRLNPDVNGNFVCTGFQGKTRLWRDMSEHKEAYARRMYGPKWRQEMMKRAEAREKALAEQQVLREKLASAIQEGSVEMSQPIEIPKPENEL